MHQNRRAENYTEVSHVLEAFNLFCSEHWEFFVQVSLSLFFFDLLWVLKKYDETFFSHSRLFVVIYLDELIKRSLSCHKKAFVRMDILYKSKWCKKVKYGDISPAQFSLPCLLTLHQPCLARLASVCQCVWLFQMWCEHSILSDWGGYFVNSRSLHTLMVLHCCIPQVILNLQLALLKSFSWDVCFKECVNS